MKSTAPLTRVSGLLAVDYETRCAWLGFINRAPRRAQRGLIKFNENFSIDRNNTIYITMVPIGDSPIRQLYLTLTRITKYTVYVHVEFAAHPGCDNGTYNLAYYLNEENVSSKRIARWEASKNIGEVGPFPYWTDVHFRGSITCAGVTRNVRGDIFTGKGRT